MIAKDVEVEKKEEEFKQEAADKEEEFKKAASVKDFVVDASAGEEGGIEQPHVWTYVLVDILLNQALSIKSAF